jgi:AcrR family transcriptional regulator
MEEAVRVPTSQRILEATLEVLSRDGPQRLSLLAVAAAAGVSRPTLYRWFPSKDALLAAFGLYEQEKFDAGIAAAIAGLDGSDRLEAVLRFIVEYQHSSSLGRIVAVEPGHVIEQMTRVLPIMRDRLLEFFPGLDGVTVASVVTRIALSHALIPDDDPYLFLAELRSVAGLDGAHIHLSRRRALDRSTSGSTRRRAQ